MGVFDNLVNKENQKQGLDLKTIGLGILKESIKVGEAIVSFDSTSGIAGFKFHVPQSEKVRLENDITDHYVDNNRPVQDHISQKPVILTLEGLQGEYLYSVKKLETILSGLRIALPLVEAFLPRLGDHLTAVKSRISPNVLKSKSTEDYEIDEEAGVLRKKTTYQVAKKEINYFDLWALMQEVYKLKSAQTRAFLFFEALWKSQAIFTVDTTWKRYNNMVIQSIEALRDENLDITSFTITCKQMNFIQSEVIKLADTSVGRRQAQESLTVKKGIDKGKKVNI